jgi:hypothetical protein
MRRLRWAHLEQGDSFQDSMKLAKMENERPGVILGIY